MNHAHACMAQELESLDARVAEVDAGPSGDFLDRLCQLMDKYGVQRPQIRVR